jgi:transcriptional regulator with XRE-family HTH domain
MNTIADRILLRCKDMEITPAELARRAKVPKTTLQSILDTPNRSPRGDTVDKLARALGVDHSWLAVGAGVNPPTTTKAANNAAGLTERQERILLAGVKEGLRQAGFDPDSPDFLRRATSAFDKAKADLLSKREDVG